MEVVEAVAPCEACGRFNYGADETACTLPEDLGPDEEFPQHCHCWYDCEACCVCGDYPVVLHGPAVPVALREG